MASPIASSQVLALFPTFVWKAELEAEVREAIRLRAGAWIEGALSSAPPLGRGESWQSDPDLQRLEAFGELLGSVEHLTRGVLEFLRIAHEGFAVTGLWANVNAPGAGHATHAHSNNFLSGVYYLRVQPGADTIEFHDPRVQAAVVRPPVTELSGENADQVVVRVASGSLLLFPSWLEHSVAENQSKEPRVSVSFNVMFTRYAETMGAPLWTGGRR